MTVAVGVTLSLLVLTGCGSTQPTNEVLGEMQQSSPQGSVTLRLSNEDRHVVDQLRLDETDFVWSTPERKLALIANAVCRIKTVSAADYNVAVEAFGRYSDLAPSPERAFNDSAAALELLVATSMQNNCGL